MIVYVIKLTGDYDQQSCVCVGLLPLCTFPPPLPPWTVRASLVCMRKRRYCCVCVLTKMLIIRLKYYVWLQNLHLCSLYYLLWLLLPWDCYVDVSLFCFIILGGFSVFFNVFFMARFLWTFFMCIYKGCSRYAVLDVTTIFSLDLKRHFT